MDHISSRLIKALKIVAGKKRINVSDYITERLDREGFARRTLQNRNLKKGEHTRIKIKKKAQPIDKYIYPTEFSILNTVAIPSREIEQDPRIIKDVANQIYESILVQEDRAWKRQADRSPSKPFKNFAEMKSALGKEVPGATWIFGSKAYTKFVANADLDPVSKRQLVKTGKISKLLGLPIHTDFHRSPAVKVLDDDDIYLVGQPKYLGYRQVRKPLKVYKGPDPLGQPNTVFNYNTIQSITLANPNGVVRRKV